MKNEIIQKKLHITRQAKIMDTKVCYKSSSFGKEAEVNISYEDLSRDKESHIHEISLLKFGMGIFAFFSFVSIVYRNDKDFDPTIWKFWVGLLCIVAIAYFITREKLWKIRVQNNTYLFFFKNSPNKESVDDFIETLFESRDKYLRDTYFFEVTKNMPFESQKNNLQWLRRIEVISKEEFDVRKKELDKSFSQELTKIGF